MNQKRSWPGVPKRYRIRSWSSVMRPKSMATVVVVLSPVWVRSSIPAEADVITASVRSGLISETAPTNVVLPTPKPPATTIFADVVEREGPPLELAKSTEHPFEQSHVWLTAGALVALAAALPVTARRWVCVGCLRLRATDGRHGLQPAGGRGAVLPRIEVLRAGPRPRPLI